MQIQCSSQARWSHLTPNLFITSKGFNTPISPIWVLFTQSKVSPAYCKLLCGSFLATPRVLCGLWGDFHFRSGEKEGTGDWQKGGETERQARLEVLERFADRRELNPGKPRLSLTAGKTTQQHLLSLVYQSYSASLKPPQPRESEVRTPSPKPERSEWNGCQTQEKPHYPVSAMRQMGRTNSSLRLWGRD